MGTEVRKPMDAQPSGSDGAIKEWKHTPNLTPKGKEIKKDELYVLNGDTIIRAYHILMSSRAGSLATLAKIPVVAQGDYETYLSYSKYINETLFSLISGIPLAQVLQAQEAQRTALEDEKRKAAIADDNINVIPLTELANKFGIGFGNATIDEKKPPTEPPSESIEPPEKEE